MAASDTLFFGRPRGWGGSGSSPRASRRADCALDSACFIARTSFRASLSAYSSPAMRARSAASIWRSRESSISHRPSASSSRTLRRISVRHRSAADIAKNASCSVGSGSIGGIGGIGGGMGGAGKMGGGGGARGGGGAGGSKMFGRGTPGGNRAVSTASSAAVARSGAARTRAMISSAPLLIERPSAAPDPGGTRAGVEAAGGAGAGAGAGAGGGGAAAAARGRRRARRSPSAAARPPRLFEDFRSGSACSSSGASRPRPPGRRRQRSAGSGPRRAAARAEVRAVGPRPGAGPRTTARGPRGEAPRARARAPLAPRRRRTRAPPPRDRARARARARERRLRPTRRVVASERRRGGAVSLVGSPPKIGNEVDDGRR